MLFPRAASTSVLSYLLFTKCALSETIKVDVGMTGVVFSPSNVQAKVGDSVQFVFYPMEHSVTEGDQNTPCEVGSVKNGFNSGTISVSNGGATTYTLLINDTSPHYYYCSVPGHCQAGMVGAINGDSASVTKYMQAARDTNSSQVVDSASGGVVASGGSSSGSSSSSSSSASGSSSSSASSGSQTSGGSGSSPLNTASPSGAGTSSGTSAKPSATGNAGVKGVNSNALEGAAVGVLAVVLAWAL